MSPTRAVVYLAGTAWDGVQGTDRQLVTRLAEKTDVVWVDPPISALRWVRHRRTRRLAKIGISEVAPGVRRLRVLTPPGVTKPMGRAVARRWQDSALKRVLRHLDVEVVATVLAKPEGRFPGLPGRRVFYVTDDWLAGAALMGLRRGRINHLMRANIADAHVVGAVSQDLLESLSMSSTHGQHLLLLPNGCEPRPSDAPVKRPADVPEQPYALLVGQLNERLDIETMTRVVEEGTELVVVGPRSEREPETSRALDILFRHPRVHWLGRRPADQLGPYLAWAAVGITPYADTAFNRSSFPLKTLEYLAWGLPVVSTDLPAVDWLNTDLITVARSSADFARRTRDWCLETRDEDLVQQRLELAAHHSWTARAETLLRYFGDPENYRGSELGYRTAKGQQNKEWSTTDSNGGSSWISSMP